MGGLLGLLSVKIDRLAAGSEPGSGVRTGMVPPLLSSNPSDWVMARWDRG